MRRTTAAVGSAALAMMIGSCSIEAPATGPAATPYSPPGWMAAQVQANDELIAKQSACLESAGYVFTVRGDGQFLAPEGTDVSAFASALRTCTAEALGALDGWRPGPEELAVLHDRQLDVVACLRHEGYVIDDVPSQDAYVDSGGTWTPYDELAVDGEVMIELRRTCPDPGPHSL